MQKANTAETLVLSHWRWDGVWNVGKGLLAILRIPNTYETVLMNYIGQSPRWLLRNVPKNSQRACLYLNAMPENAASI